MAGVIAADPALVDEELHELDEINALLQEAIDIQPLDPEHVPALAHDTHTLTQE